MPKRSLKPLRHPRPAVTDTVRAYAVAPNKIRIVFTTDVIEKLLELHMKVHGGFYFMPVRNSQRYRQFRLQLGRMSDLRIPAVFVQIEPPTFDPRGRRIMKRPKNVNHYFIEIVATKLRLRHPIPARKLELLWADQGKPGGMNGLVLTFPDEDFDFDMDMSALPLKSSGVSPYDLVVL